MLIDLADLIPKYEMAITGVLHVGAHLGEEAAKYDECGIKNVWWIEGNPDLLEQLWNNVHPYGHHVLGALVTDEEGAETTFHITNNGQSSSILTFGTHRRVSPDVHFTEEKVLRSVTIDSILDNHHFYGADLLGCNFLNMDLQGAELIALRGAEGYLNQFDYLYLEVNVDELYVGCVRLPELDEWLQARGFRQAEVRLAGNPNQGQPGWVGWGDGLYIREGVRD